MNPAYFGLIPPAFLLLFIAAVLIYNAWYRRNYIDERGWHKCWECKKVESEMYWHETVHGRVYRCREHAFGNRPEPKLTPTQRLTPYKD